MRLQPTPPSVLEHLLRTEAVARRKEPLLRTDAEHHQEGARTMADAGSLVEDDVLRLVLMCAHPALAPESASALSLRLVLGVPTADIARLFLVPEGRRIRSFWADYSALCADMTFNRWTELRPFHVLLGSAGTMEEVRRIGRAWLDLGPERCTDWDAVAGLR